MFGWSIYTTYDASKFVLTVPLHYMAMLVSIPAVLCILVFGMKAGHPWRNWLLVLAIFVAYGFESYCSRLTLDRTSGTATLREFQYYHWTTRTFKLSDIDRLYVSTGSTTSQIQVQFNTGSVQSITFLDQNGGKEEAVFAANRFLGVGR